MPVIAVFAPSGVGRLVCEVVVSIEGSGVHVSGKGIGYQRKRLNCDCPSPASLLHLEYGLDLPNVVQVWDELSDCGESKPATIFVSSAGPKDAHPRAFAMKRYAYPRNGWTRIVVVVFVCMCVVRCVCLSPKSSDHICRHLSMLASLSVMCNLSSRSTSLSARLTCLFCSAVSNAYVAAFSRLVIVRLANGKVHVRG